MNLTLLDFLVIGAYFTINLLIGLWYRQKAIQSTDEYFVGGRNVSWWLAGTSMVATTFAADTPLAVTGLVASYGIAGNWLWWSMCLSNMLTVFFFARLWRRSGVLTDVEFAEIRYSGKPASFLRIFRAIYLAIPINCIVMSWVNLAMVKILMTLFPISKSEGLIVVLGIMILTTLLSSLSGLWGVLVTDFFQFILMMGMIIALAVYSVRSVGGIHALQSRLMELQPEKADALFSFLPEIGSPWMPMIAFFVYIAVNWWATWYPGSEPGGGGYVAQRIFSAKDEKNSLLATLWFSIAHYAVRPWPWILTALASFVLYPSLQDKESGYVRTLMDPAVFPVELRGLMIASFIAAYMSTISTQLNWGASYLLNDVYRRFIGSGKNDQHYVRVSQVATVFLMLASIVVTYYQESIAGAWKLLIALGAGTGAVYILRWFWWRVNAWSEIVAMAASFVVSLFTLYGLGLKNEDPREFAISVLITVGCSTLAWITATYLTRPETDAVLMSFYEKTRPAALGWGHIATQSQEKGIISENDLGRNAVAWLLGSAMIYFFLFGTGKLIFGKGWLGLGLLCGGALCAWLLYRDLSRRGWNVIQSGS